MPSHSTFGTLLKHSKFSSFDPRISQVYTTHGGDAHRGHWGFKRPLPLRRRGAYIAVKNVDTPEYQTEWNSAEPQALWIKNWDELKVTPDKEFPEHIVDSDYIPQTQSPEHWRQPYIPNLEVMPRNKFAQYLGKIRANRDTFLKQRTARAQHGAVTSYQLSNLSKPSTPWHDIVATQFSQRRRSNPRSREIEHLPHNSGGLSYAQYSPLQTFMMTKERKGRMADEERFMMRYVASFAGMAGTVQRKHAGLAKPVVWEDPNRTGEVMIRPLKAEVEGCPIVVDKRQGLKAAKIKLELRVWDEQSHYRSNPHSPGSPEYIAAEPPRSVQELTTQAVVNRVGARKTKKNVTTIALLRSAMAKSID
ncbi:mitochondrial ribosomal protein subunit-domain-containing protein [Boletus edulis BED1]|uniref:Mitochondrial ribosomal protein subunit-domain-containing protein n=1 Tax=Boletus edulis BED1 TaxID=1328754 RepID=A0AAD4C4Q7_BOLED|nr:mitochondrial ribosomal protein subunit-domain-containing protein [Boletus edulis BED1]